MRGKTALLVASAILTALGAPTLLFASQDLLASSDLGLPGFGKPTRDVGDSRPDEASQPPRPAPETGATGPTGPVRIYQAQAGSGQGADPGDTQSGRGNRSTKLERGDKQTKQSGGVGPDPGISAQDAKVTIGNNFFEPKTVNVTVGGTVTWTMESDTPEGHNVTRTKKPESFQSPHLTKKGETFSHSFTETGTFAYECTIHQGMDGTVKVDTASSNADPGFDNQGGSGTSPGGGTPSPGSSGSHPSTGLDTIGLALLGAALLSSGLLLMGLTLWRWGYL